MAAPRTGMLQTARGALFVLALIGIQLGTAGSTAAQDGPADRRPHGVIALVVEEAPSSAALRAGAEDAAAERGLALEVHEVPADRSRQRSAVARLRDEPDAAAPVGLLLAVRDPAALAEAIGSTVGSGVPFVVVRHGRDAWRSLGAVGFVGQDESLAGAAAGDQLVELGASKAICVRDVALDDIQASRCRAAAERMAAAGAAMQSLFALDPPGDPTGVRDAVTARLIHDPDIDAILATEEDGLAAAIEARERASRPHVLIAAFEPDADVLSQIESGSVRFAVDQQPYVQGYLAIVAISLLEGSAGAGAAGPIIVGPRIVPAPS